MYYFCQQLYIFNCFVYISIGLAGEDIWIGLTNPNKVVCQNSDCTDKLIWHTGEDFKYGLGKTPTVTMSGTATGITLTVAREITDSHGLSEAKFFCKTDCYTDYRN